MKANFKINKIDECSNDTDSSNLFPNVKQNEIEFEEYVKTLPKGWNLWSIRNISNK